jgi:Skp family chaperone for outer membrane proteins
MKNGFGHRWAAGLAVVALLALGAFVANAANSPLRSPPAAPKIATVDLEDVIGGLNERTDKEKALKAAGEEAQKRLLALKAEFDADKAKLEAMPNTPPKFTAAKALREKAIEIEWRERNEQRLLTEMKADMIRDLYSKITEVVGRMAKAEGYQMVLASDQKAAINSSDLDSVMRSIAIKRMLYVDPALDITPDVVKMLNNEYAAFGGKSAAPKTP